MTIDADRAPAKLQRTTAVGRLHVEEWGTGDRVVLVHGSLATGAEEWEAQRPLADEGFRLVVFDRRGYGQSPLATGEDFLVDADDIVELMGDGAHLVGHSYGGLGAMIAAARRPDVDEVVDPPRSPSIGASRGRSGVAGRSSTRSTSCGARTSRTRSGSSAS